MNTDFAAGILVARMLEGMKFAVGPTIAARRRVLQAIGGFDRLKDYLAEDFVMGKFAADAGHGVILSSYVIEHHIGSADLRHNCGPSSALGAQHPALPPLRLCRTVVHYASASGVVALRRKPGVVAGAAGDPRRSPAGGLHNFGAGAARQDQLAAAADRGRVTAFCFWLAGFFGNTIVWRGRRYRLYSDGRFELLPSPSGVSEATAAPPKSFPSLNMNAFPRHVTVCPQKPMNHTRTATKSRTGTSTNLWPPAGLAEPCAPPSELLRIASQSWHPVVPRPTPNLGT